MSGHIELVTPPFAGHLHPVLGIGVELARRGLPVRVVSTAAARAQIEAAGLSAVALATADDGLIAAIADPPERIGRHPLRLHRQFRSTLGVLATISAELDARYDADPPAVVVADFTLPVAGVIGLRHGARWVTSHPSPVAIGSTDGTPAYLGGLLPPRGAAGRLRDAAGRTAVRAFKRGVFALNAGPLRELGFSGAFRPDGTEQVYSPDLVLALGLAELELPRTWPPAVRFVGPVRYTPPGRPGAWGTVRATDAAGGTWEPNGASRTGEPPRPRVLVSRGTHLAGETARLLDAVERAAALLPEVAFEMTLGGTHRPADRPLGPAGGRSGEAADAPPGRGRLLDYADYGALGRYDAIVHHGGTGIAQAALAAGRPSVVIPVDYDQPDIAARLVHHDLAERLHPSDRRGEAGARRLADAVGRALRPSPERSAALARFRAACAAADGAVGAADLIEQAVAARHPIGDGTTGAHA